LHCVALLRGSPAPKDEIPDWNLKPPEIAGHCKDPGRDPPSPCNAPVHLTYAS